MVGPGVEPRFHVLALPREMTAAVPSASDPHDKTGAIDQDVRGGLPVARLDVYVPFGHDVAAAIYPADAATAKLFDEAPAIVNWRLLVPRRDAYTLVRWIDPAQIRVLAPPARE